MTPKEKANELYDKYWIYFTHEKTVNSIFKHAKVCALIAVDEIIKSQPSYPMAWHLGIEINGLVDNAIFPFNYWKEVKQEIENL